MESVMQIIIYAFMALVGLYMVARPESCLRKRVREGNGPMKPVATWFVRIMGVAMVIIGGYCIVTSVM